MLGLQIGLSHQVASLALPLDLEVLTERLGRDSARPPSKDDREITRRFEFPLHRDPC